MSVRFLGVLRWFLDVSVWCAWYTILFGCVWVRIGFWGDFGLRLVLSVLLLSTVLMIVRCGMCCDLRWSLVDLGVGVVLRCWVGLGFSWWL